MENDDCFIQVPDENSLERWGAEGGGGWKKQRKTERKEAKSIVHSVGLARWSSWSIGQERVFVRHRDQDPFAWVGHRNTPPSTPTACFPSPALYIRVINSDKLIN